MSKVPQNNSTKKKGKSNLAFFKLHTVFYIFSAILLIIGISTAYSVFMDGDTAKVNAQQSLEEVEEIILTNDQIEPTSSSGPPNMYEEQSMIDNGDTTDPAGQDTIETETKKTEKPEDGYTTIAKIEMEKIGLHTSVLSRWSYELLDISVNKFHGPEPNEPGNFIVIGHNYRNGSHFGSLDLLEIGDLIELTDVSGKTIEYEVYEMLIIKPDEVEKLATNHPLALTLITCDTDNEYRLVVKSKAVNR